MGTKARKIGIIKGYEEEHFGSLQFAGNFGGKNPVKRQGKEKSAMQRVEARFASLERRDTDLGTRIEEVALEQKSSVQELKDYMDQGFEQAYTYIMEHVTEPMATKEDLKKLEDRVTTIESKMATKEDIIALRSEMLAMEDRILGVLNRILEQRN